MSSSSATGTISLNGSAIAVQRNDEALVKLACMGAGACAGKLTLTGKVALGKGKRAKAKTTTEILGTTGFSIPPGKTVSVEVALTEAGRMLLGVAHGHCSAVLTVLKSSPALAQTSTENVRLVQVKTVKAKRRDPRRGYNLY